MAAAASEPRAAPTLNRARPEDGDVRRRRIAGNWRAADNSVRVHGSAPRVGVPARQICRDALSTFCARVRRCAVSDERACRAAVRLWCRVVARCSRSHEGLETTPENREADQHREPHDERGGEGDVPLAHLLCGRHRDVCILIDHGGHRMRLACASRHASAHRREGAGVCAACSVRSSVPPRARTHAPYLISRYLGDTRSDPNARSESRQRRKTPRSRENAPEDVADRTPTRRSVR
jgi:hypothetical protein